MIAVTPGWRLKSGTCGSTLGLIADVPGGADGEDAFVAAGEQNPLEQAAALGAISGLLLGRFIDAGHGGRAVWLAAGSLVVVIALRATSCGRPGPRGRGQRRGRAGACPLRADHDDGSLQSGEGLAVRAAFPYRRGGRLGRRRGERMHGRGGPALGRRADFTRYPERARTACWRRLGPAFVQNWFS